MRHSIYAILALSLLMSTTFGSHACNKAAMEEMNNWYRTSECCNDPIFDSLAISMVGWGLVLFTGIAILTGLVPNSRAKTTSSTTTSQQ